MFYHCALWSLQIKLVFSVYRLWKDLVNFLSLMKFLIKCYPGNISIEHMNTKTENGRDGLHYSVYHQRYSARFKLCSSLYLNIQSVPYHIRLSPSFNAKIKTITLEKTTIFRKKPYSIFQNNSFFWNFLFSPENRNLDRLTI